MLDLNFIKKIKQDAEAVISELLDKAQLSQGSVFVLGCSSSEICGNRIGTASSAEAAQALYDVLLPELNRRGVYLAAQCCEHLNRALVVERTVALRQGLDIVNVVPHAHAGGASATLAYSLFDDPVMVETIKADAGMDVGGTLIGMHLRATAVPVKTTVRTIGEAIVICARTRPKFIGGERAIYNQDLL
ncbi:MAG: TIGR01440 family protein [Ruminococcus sp.]|nr:TIGR01440 family protein [Ruminococcus sp.]